MDYALVSDSAMDSVQEFHVEKTNFGSDHRLLALDFRYRHSEKITLPRPEYRYNVLNPFNVKVLPQITRTAFRGFESECRVAAEASPKSLSLRRKAVDRLNDQFMLRLNLCTCTGVGLKFNKHWHTDSWSPELSELTRQRSELWETGDSKRVKMLDQKIAKISQKVRQQKYKDMLDQVDREGIFSRTFNRFYKKEEFGELSL